MLLSQVREMFILTLRLTKTTQATTLQVLFILKSKRDQEYAYTGSRQDDGRSVLI